MDRKKNSPQIIICDITESRFEQKVLSVVTRVDTSTINRIKEAKILRLSNKSVVSKNIIQWQHYLQFLHLNLVLQDPFHQSSLFFHLL